MGIGLHTGVMRTVHTTQTYRRIGIVEMALCPFECRHTFLEQAILFWLRNEVKRSDLGPIHSITPGWLCSSREHIADTY